MSSRPAMIILLSASLTVAYADPASEGARAEVPEAILGRAGPPAGSDLAYFEEDPRTMGYLAEPAGAHTV